MLKVKANERKTTLNFQFSTLTFGRACSRSAIIKQACYCSLSIAAFNEIDEEPNKIVKNRRGGASYRVSENFMLRPKSWVMVG